MNDPKNQPIDNEEQRAWLEEYKRDSALSWNQIAARLGPEFKSSTLSLFVGSKYAGRLEWIAEGIFKFRQTLVAQAAIRAEGPDIPAYFPTETSTQLVRLLQYAQRGRITVGALAAGISKSTTADHFRACNANVFLITVFPSTSGIYGMLKAVLKQLGVPNASGSPEVLSNQVMDRVRNLASPLLIFDEAQHLTVRAIEEIRGWYDITGVGIALLGNKSLLQQLEGGNRSDAFAQIFSRVSLRIVRLRPFAADVDALLEAWRITDEKVSAEIHRIAQMPGALRSATWTLELAHMLASGGKEDLSLGHVQDAWAQLGERRVSYEKVWDVPQSNYGSGGGLGSSPFKYGISNHPIGPIRDPAGILLGSQVSRPAAPATGAERTLAFTRHHSDWVAFNGATKTSTAGPDGSPNAVEVTAATASMSLYKSLNLAGAENQLVHLVMPLATHETTGIEKLRVSLFNSAGGPTAVRREVILEPRWNQLSIDFIVPEHASPAAWQLQLQPLDYVASAGDKFRVGNMHMHTGASPLAAPPTWRNVISNPMLLGAVPGAIVSGSGGSLPLGWSAIVANGLAGLVATVVKAGQDLTGRFLDLKLSGTVTTGGILRLFIEPGLAIENPAAVQNWTFWSRVALLAGSFANMDNSSGAGHISLGVVREDPATGAYLSESANSRTPAGATPEVIGGALLHSDNFLRTRPYWLLRFTPGVIDATVRLYVPDIRRPA